MLETQWLRKSVWSMRPSLVLADASRMMLHRRQQERDGGNHDSEIAETLMHRRQSTRMNWAKLQASCIVALEINSISDVALLS